MMVCTSWEEPKYQLWIEDEFENDWCGRNRRLAIMDVPEAVRRKLLSYAPPNGRRPRWLRKRSPEADAGRNAVWSFIGRAHKAKNGGMVGLATAPVVPWPHQVQVFRRLQANRPSRLLIADEVGLGKTIQAGLFLRQAWLEGRRRILVMAPAGVIRQWQMELREKLNLDWPVYDGKKPGLAGHARRRYGQKGACGRLDRAGTCHRLKPPGPEGRSRIRHHGGGVGCRGA